MTERRSPVGETACCACGVRFVCGAVAGLSSCWCMDKPRLTLAPDAAEGNCYCPACLEKLEKRLTDAGRRCAPAT
ncbi:cysteine-rich CWC family protein [Candidatus Accumulibacter aalborgensis]|uniref:cysteine-rich CWC family protein n=1 Tax=Candidatus Accumulibacter aalborgensis TaxID=1860102 RepID=UPI002688E2F8